MFESAMPLPSGRRLYNATVSAAWSAMAPTSGHMQFLDDKASAGIAGRRECAFECPLPALFAALSVVVVWFQMLVCAAALCKAGPDAEDALAREAARTMMIAWGQRFIFDDVTVEADYLTGGWSSEQAASGVLADVKSKNL